MKNVLILCTGNSCRSQMAHGYLAKFAGDKAKVYSAGIQTHGLNPGAVKTMEQDGVSITHHTSNLVEQYLDIDFDFILTVCDHANENCPYIPSKNALRLHRDFYDPSKATGTPEQLEKAFTKAREEIKAYVQDFVQTHL